MRSPQWERIRSVVKLLAVAPPLWDGERFSDDAVEQDELYRKDRVPFWTTESFQDLTRQERVLKWFFDQ
eukprot:5408007-Lingulodinium_polyedra.AAC.1